MTHRSDPWPKDPKHPKPSLFERKFRIDFPADLPVSQASGHAALRCKDFRKVFCGLAIMRREKMLPLVPVTLRGAAHQFETGHGRRAENREGAHRLPRQLVLDGRPIADWLRAAGADEVALLSMLGAEAVTTVLPTVCNEADSLWETKGLSEAFRSAAAEIVGWPQGKNDALRFFPGMWARFHRAGTIALAAAIAHCAAGDARLGPLEAYRVAHQAAQPWQDEPGSVVVMLNMTFR